jgi:hypothetical protein
MLAQQTEASIDSKPLGSELNDYLNLNGKKVNID